MIEHYQLAMCDFDQMPKNTIFTAYSRMHFLTLGEGRRWFVGFPRIGDRGLGERGRGDRIRSVRDLGDLLGGDRGMTRFY